MRIERKQIMWHAARALLATCDYRANNWLPSHFTSPCRLCHPFSLRACHTDCSHVLAESAPLIGRPVQRCYQCTANHWLVEISDINCLRRLFLPSRRVRFLTVIAKLMEESVGKFCIIVCAAKSVVLGQRRSRELRKGTVWSLHCVFVIAEQMKD